MSDREQVLALSRIAFLDALILSFLAIQFVVPLMMIFLLFVIPTIIALQFYHLPFRYALISGILLCLLTLAFFGLPIALWELLYFIVGAAVGLGRRIHVHMAFRLLFATIAFAVTLFLITLVFGAFARVSWQNAMGLLERISWPFQLPWPWIILVGILVWATLLSLGVEGLLSRILKQLYVGGKYYGGITGKGRSEKSRSEPKIAGYP
jgi:hypothetical protein